MTPELSWRRLPNDKVQPGCIGERAEIAVSRNKWNPAIDTTLGDQGIAQTRFRRFANTLARNTPARSQ